jgi:adenine-specific DNA-methyltransferase
MTSQNSGSDERYAHLERRRIQLQAELDVGRPQAERNRLGQFATPPDLALDVLTTAKKLTDHAPIRFLDPAFGTGAFYHALLACFRHQQIAAAQGYELDPYYGAPALHLWEGSGLTLHLKDFTKAQAPAAESERFNLIVCNPPYVRHHHLSGEDKERLRKLCLRVSGFRADGFSGLYCYFLVLSHNWLAENGLGLWLIPSEFMDVNYGVWLKRYLIEKVTLLRIHRFDPNEVQFGDALVSSAVVCFRKALPRSDHRVEFSFGGTLNKPRLEGSISLAVLRHERKWTRFLESEKRNAGGYVLGDFFSIKRGLATGDNSYFILTAARSRELGLPKRFLRPILPSPRHVTGNQILADHHGNPMTEPQLFLVDCGVPEESVRRDYPALWRYFEEGKRRGLAGRYLCQHRTPWYAQEDRPAAPIVATYANVYLMMYPRGVLLSSLQSRPELADQIWDVLSRLDARILLDEGRVYGGGLHKLEPKELANVPADNIAALLGLPAKGAARQLELITHQGSPDDQ